MNGRLMPRFRRLRDEVLGTPRLRWGVIAIVAILFVYQLLVLSDWRQDLQRQYQQRTTELYKMASLAGQGQWIGRASEAKAMRQALEAEIPAASSIGIAQAEVQDSVRAIMKAFGQGLSVNTQAAAQVAGRPGLWRIPVAVNGMIQPRLLLEILRRVEGSPKLVTVEQFSFALQQNRPVVSMTLVSYYRIGAKKEAGDAAR